MTTILYQQLPTRVPIWRSAHNSWDGCKGSIMDCSGRGPPAAAVAPLRASAVHRRRANKHATAAADWSYGPYPAAGADWAGAQGAYSDPRAAAPGVRRRPAPPERTSPPERPTDGPSTSYDGQQGGQDADPLSEMARMVVDGVTAFLSSIVGCLSDWALSLLPQHVKRRAVENSVKGALALLGLALLQSVLSLVLTVGTVVLVVYTAHQVFGLQVPFLPGGQGPDRGPAGPEGAGPAGGGAGAADPRFYGGGGAQPYAGYGPYQPGYDRYYAGYGGRGQPYPPRPGAAGGGRAQGPKGPVIDVYYESP
ncbi:hypothetical protein PLESTM_001553900 [Pleodorina starrii]|nr:hypothetical protein PLESTM_001553900 [Pleodorina starrii]